MSCVVKLAAEDCNASSIKIQCDVHGKEIQFPDSRDMFNARNISMISFLYKLTQYV